MGLLVGAGISVGVSFDRPSDFRSNKQLPLRHKQNVWDSRDPTRFGLGNGGNAVAQPLYFRCVDSLPAIGGGGHGTLTERAIAASTQGNTGWALGTSTGYARMTYNAQSSGWAAPAQPSGAPTTNDCYRSENTYTGQFAAGTWTFALSMEAQAVSGGTAAILFRVWRSTDPTGATGVNEITAGAVATSSAGTSSSPQTQSTSASLSAATLTGEYIFFQVAVQSLGPGIASADFQVMQNSQANSAPDVTTPVFTPGAGGGATQFITTTGIASAEAVGSDKISLVLAPTGIATAQAFGSDKINLGVAPIGIATAQAFGTDKLSLVLATTGIATAQAFGAAKVSEIVAPAGIATAQAFGSDKLSLVVAPSGITSAQAFGAAKITEVVAPAGIASAQAFGTDKISLGVVTTGIASAQALGVPSIQLVVKPTSIASAYASGTASLALRVAVTGIPSAEAFGSPVISQANVVQPAGIASAQAFGTDVINLGVAATGIASAQAFGTDVIDLVVKPTGIASAQALGVPSVAEKLSLSGISSAQAFGADALAEVVKSTGIASAEAIGNPTVSLATSIRPTGIVSTEAFGNAQINLRVVATSTTSSEAFGAPSVGEVVKLTGIASGVAVGVPTVTVSAGRTVSPVGIPSAQAFGRALVTGGNTLDFADGVALPADHPSVADTTSVTLSATTSTFSAEFGASVDAEIVAKSELSPTGRAPLPLPRAPVRAPETAPAAPARAPEPAAPAHEDVSLVSGASMVAAFGVLLDDVIETTASVGASVRLAHSIRLDVDEVELVDVGVVVAAMTSADIDCVVRRVRPRLDFKVVDVKATVVDDDDFAIVDAGLED